MRGKAASEKRDRLQIMCMSKARIHADLLHWLRLLIAESIPLSVQPRLVDQDVRVRSDTGHGACSVLIDEVHLL